VVIGRASLGLKATVESWGVCATVARLT